ncbi:hypothetical protein PQR57_46670 [Paraburkholderia dipogonis]|uniref:Uncharacterized protein n=1 Tax=Paraburkholderia dipogonis TaxID=1211383 RepID=A0ABW9B617_9BURK
MSELRFGLRARGQPLDGLRTVYGKVTVKSPRLWPCACQRTARTAQHVVHLLSKDLSWRVTPELEYLQAKWAAHLPYRQAANMLKEVLPLDKGISSSGIRNRILDIGKQLDTDIERDIAKLPQAVTDVRIRESSHVAAVSVDSDSNSNSGEAQSPLGAWLRGSSAES